MEKAQGIRQHLSYPNFCFSFQEKHKKMHSQNCQKAFSMQTHRGCCWEDHCGELAVLATPFLPHLPGPTLRHVISNASHWGGAVCHPLAWGLTLWLALRQNVWKYLCDSPKLSPPEVFCVCGVLLCSAFAVRKPCTDGSTGLHKGSRTEVPPPTCRGHPPHAYGWPTRVSRDAHPSPRHVSNEHLISTDTEAC